MNKPPLLSLNNHVEGENPLVNKPIMVGMHGLKSWMICHKSPRNIWWKKGWSHNKEFQERPISVCCSVHVHATITLRHHCDQFIIQTRDKTRHKRDREQHINQSDWFTRKSLLQNWLSNQRIINNPPMLTYFQKGKRMKFLATKGVDRCKQNTIKLGRTCSCRCGWENSCQNLHLYSKILYDGAFIVKVFLCKRSTIYLWSQCSQG